MFLKNLEIVGFKSFADRVQLDFEPGITAVVGPNGCGKSNIIDATRWCLGEMSVKSLRSSLMMDVVFNGSTSRPPQNMAEVTLTFDNSDKRLPIDFSDVAVTRRLFRSGESEYFINKTQCRLRDIKELFLDTGMGEDGYSCMEQGKVEWLLQAKPEERRELFEEAAGVSKYRARREEALRKLERIEIDLSRLNDIVSVTKDQIRKLENAVNRAKTYERIRNELKTMEISDWIFQLGATKEQLVKLEGQLNQSQNEFESLNTQIHQHETLLANYRLNLTQTEEELLLANQQLVAIDADIKIGGERLAQAQQRELELQKQIENISHAMDRERNRIRELTVQAEEQKSALEQIMGKGSSIETDYETAVSQYESTLHHLEDKRQKAKTLRDLILDRAQERSRLQQQMSYATSDVSRLESITGNLEKEKARVQEECQSQKSSLDQIEKQIGELAQILGEKTGDLEKFTAQLDKLNAEQSEIRDLIMSVTEDMARLKGQIHSIESQQSQDPYLSGAQAIAAAGIPRIHGPLSRLIRSSSSDRDLVAATIGEHLSDLIAETAEDAEAAISYLTRNGKGRARIWILEKLMHQTTVNSGLSHGDTLFSRLYCEDRFKPVLAHLSASLWIKGSTIYGPAVINGGVDPVQWKSHVSHRMPELQELLSEKEKSKNVYETSLATNESRQVQIRQQRENAIKEMEEFRIRLELMKEEATKSTSKWNLLLEESKVVESELKIGFQDKKKAEDVFQVSKDRFESLQSQEQNDHAQLDVLHQETSELQLIHATANADLSTKKEKHLQLQEQLHWQKGILDHTQQELNHVNSSLKNHQATLDQSRQDLGASKLIQEEAKNLIAVSMEKRRGASDAVSAVQTKRVQIASDIQNSEKELNRIRSAWTEIQQVIQDDRVQESTLKSKIEIFLQKLQDQYEMTIESAQLSFTPELADPESLERLKKRISNIGPINLAAPQEHAELLEKDIFLSSQQEDLLKAKDDLRQAITRINTTTREHFRETFDKVRENFRTIYSQLFQGGEADLRLTDEADILNAGVDIYCQPPGKKLLHISLLSGGEKALTACALLFAFFQVRPSPVALLDEVDAPLDEANILRFVELIKLFSEKSQFILISHNKRTMEAATTLYGVTMEELGVSKILSARLKKEKKKIEAALETESVAV